MIELLDHLVKAWFAHRANKPAVTDFSSLRTGAQLLTDPADPVHWNIEEAMRIVGVLCDCDDDVKRRVCSRNQTHGYHIVEGLIDSCWQGGVNG